MTSTVQFGYWGKAQKAGITPNLLLNLLKVQETTGLSTQPKLEPHPTFGILIELLEYAVELESLYQGISTKSVLKIWIDYLYPACSLSRADRLERTIRNIAQPVQRIRSSSTKNSEYLNRKWKPKTTFQPDKHIKDISTELFHFGLSDSLLRSMLSYAQGTAVFKWTLQEVPKIRFYWLLHTYFQRQGLTHEQMGKVYRAIDRHLRSSTSSNRIACRKVSRMIQNHHNHHNLVQYPNSKTACKNVPKQHVPGPKESNYSKRNVVRREQRAKDQIQKLRQKASTATKAAQNASKDSEQLKAALTETIALLRREQARNRELSHNLCEAQKAEEVLNDQFEEVTQSCDQQIKSLQAYVDVLEHKNDELYDKIQELQGESDTDSIPIVATKVAGKYTQAIRELYYALLAQRIPPSKIQNIIRPVLRHLAPSIDLDALQLPSAFVAGYMRREELAVVSRAQKAITLSSAECMHLNSDGTTLNQCKKATSIVNDLVLGVHNVYDGSADAAFGDLQSEMDQLRTTAGDLGVDSENITLERVVSSTSDGAATQGKFNKLLKQHKNDEKAPEIVENKCGMHMGVNLRVAQIDGITSYNKGSADEAEPKTKHNIIDSCVHSTCKLIGHLGTPEYCHGVNNFRDYLKLKAEEMSQDAGYYKTAQTTKLERQVGSRYYTTARNSGRLFFLVPAINGFLVELKMLKSLNRLEEEVLTSIQNDTMIAHLKLDGLMFDHIYADLMMLIKSKVLDKCVLDMNQHYMELKCFLEQLSKHPEEIMNPDLQTFPSEHRLYGESPKTNHRIKKNYTAVRKRLFTCDDFDGKELYPRVAAAAKSMLDKLVAYKADQLPGGKYWNPDETTRGILLKLKPHNDACESALGTNDWISRSLQNLCQQTQSTLVEVSHNKTIQWLQSQESSVKAKVITLASTSRRSVQQNRKKTQQQISEKRLQLRREAVMKSQQKVEKRNEQKQRLEKEYLIQTVQELDKQVEEIETLPISEKEADKLIRNLVKTQSSIRTQLLHQKDARITFSVRRTPKRTSIILTELREVIAKYQTDTPDATCTFPRNPKFLVKKPIKHKLRNDNGEELWYDGIVKSYRRSNFEIQYAGEECTYIFTLAELEEDYISGELIIVV